MPNTLQLIEQVRRRLPRETDYAVAKALEMQQSTLTKVLAGKQGLGPKAVIRVAELLQRDVRDVLVLVEEDKAVRPKDREFWERRSPRITAVLALAALAFFAAMIPQNAVAGAVHPYSSTCPFYTLCEAIRKILLDFWKILVSRTYKLIHVIDGLGAPAAKPSVTYS
jgi:hypothetical protein